MILTNFSVERHLLLTDSEGKPMAVITCKAGENVDITEKVELAIKEDLTCKSVTVKSDKVIEFDLIEFNAEYVEDYEDESEDEPFTNSFTLDFICVYP